MSSANRMIDDRSVVVWSTVLRRAHGEMTRNGWRGPYPQRPFSPASSVYLVVSPQIPVPLRRSCGPGARATLAVSNCGTPPVMVWVSVPIAESDAGEQTITCCIEYIIMCRICPQRTGWRCRRAAQ